MAGLQHLIRRANKWAYTNDSSPVRRWRVRRMMAFLRCVAPPARARILDLGGTRNIWEDFDHDFHVTLANLPSDSDREVDTDRYTHVVGDACDLTELFGDGEFDVVFSNSVIEHVGEHERRRAFASEVRRLGLGYWIQTPSDRFPIEAHTGIPYYFRLPEPVRARLHRRWQRDFPRWYDMISSTCVVSRGEMTELFPDGKMYIERLLGLEKSYSFYRSWSPA